MGMSVGLGRVGNNGGKAILVASGASGDSGAQMNHDAPGFTKWTFQLIGTFTGQSVAIQGTIDPAVHTLPEGSTALPATSWFTLDAPAVTAGTEVNPLTAAGQSLNHSGPLMAVRAVSTGTTQTGTCTVLCLATP